MSMPEKYVRSLRRNCVHLVLSQLKRTKTDATPHFFSFLDDSRSILPFSNEPPHSLFCFDNGESIKRGKRIHQAKEMLDP